MIDIAKSQIRQMNPAELSPNPWNPNSVGVENMQKLKASIEKTGIFKPVLVRLLDDGSLQIIGGEHRARAAQELGMDVPVLSLGVMSDLEAKKITLIDNDGYGENDANTLSKILRELSEADEDIIGQMTYSEEQLSDLLNLSTTIDLESLGSLDDLDNFPGDDTSPDIPDARDEQAVYKTIKLKVAIDDVEFVEDLIEEMKERLEIADSDPAIARGFLFKKLLEETQDNV